MSVNGKVVTGARAWRRRFGESEDKGHDSGKRTDHLGILVQVEKSFAKTSALFVAMAEGAVKAANNTSV